MGPMVRGLLAPTRLVLVTLVVAFVVASSGCIASKKDAKEETLQEYDHAAGGSTATETKRFDVAKGTKSVKVIADTRAAGEECPNGEWTYGGPRPPGWCEPNENNADGAVVVKLTDPAGTLVETMNLPAGSYETRTVKDPMVGQWSMQISYTGGYDGPATVRVTEPAAASVTWFGGNFLELVSILLTVTLLVGGAYLYRRRSRFLARELHRIDMTVRTFGDDVEECRTNLRDMRHHLKDLLVKRKIEESHYLILERRIDQYLRDLDTPGDRHKAARATPATPAKPSTGLSEEEFDLPIEGA